MPANREVYGLFFSCRAGKRFLQHWEVRGRVKRQVPVGAEADSWPGALAEPENPTSKPSNLVRIAVWRRISHPEVLGLLSGQAGARNVISENGWKRQYP